MTVNMHRFAATQDLFTLQHPLTLQVVDQTGWSSVRSATFALGEDALHAFTDAVEEGGGMRAFLEPLPTLH